MYEGAVLKIQEMTKWMLLLMVRVDVVGFA